MHPLTPSLSSLSDDELTKKVGDLISRINFASRMGSYAMTEQLRLILDDYQHEAQIRNQKMLDEMERKSGDLNSIINIS